MSVKDISNSSRYFEPWSLGLVTKYGKCCNPTEQPNKEKGEMLAIDILYPFKEKNRPTGPVYTKMLVKMI